VLRPGAMPDTDFPGHHVHCLFPDERGWGYSVYAYCGERE